MADPLLYFQSTRHALYAGWIAGIMMRNGIEFELWVDADGNYTDTFNLHLPHLQNGISMGTPTVITLKIPNPPSDWSFTS